MAAGDRRKRGSDAALVAALAAGRTYDEAAEAASVSVRTVGRRMQEAAFRRQVAEQRQVMLTRAAGLLAGLFDEAAATLQELLSSRNEHVRLGAVRTQLEWANRLHEETALEERITALEDTVGRRGQQAGTQ